MAEVTEEQLSAEGVTLASQDEAAAAQDDESVDAVLEASELQHRGPFGEDERLDEETADEVGSIIADAVGHPARPGRPLQDGLAFENARRDEAVAQGVEATTQERLYELARQEEAQGQGIGETWDTTHNRLFTEARADEAHAEKLEEAMHGPVEPLSITPHGVDQVKRDRELAKDTPPIREAGAAKILEERGETPKRTAKRTASRKKTTTAAKAGEVVNP
jgi:hypothetical protein